MKQELGKRVAAGGASNEETSTASNSSNKGGDTSYAKLSPIKLDSSSAAAPATQPNNGVQPASSKPSTA
jgi:hypothetical protein